MADESTVRQEIASQPDTWAATWQRLQQGREALASLLAAQCWDALYFAGCGSSHYLAMAAASLHQQVTGQPARAFPSSEGVLFPATIYPDIPGQNVLLVAISCSGETTETLQAARRQRERGMPVLAITCHADSSLARESDFAFAAEEAGEASVPQTRSFTSMLLATQYIAGLVADDRRLLAALEQLPAAGRPVLEQGERLAAEVAAGDWERAIFLGSGAHYGLACEAMLKLKEMALAWSEAYHFLEFRHGPISLVDERTLVVGLLSDAAVAAERNVLDEVRALGAQTLVLGERVPARSATYAFSLDSGLAELARGSLYLLPLQLLAYERARARGLDPGRPRHLVQAVVLAEA